MTSREREAPDSSRGRRAQQKSGADAGTDSSDGGSPVMDMKAWAAAEGFRTDFPDTEIRRKAVKLHEQFLVYREAGFTNEQAFVLIQMHLQYVLSEGE